ncbi:hypothetical protein HYV89_01860 [Candidatus Woesearchaeota archaeon]|nr:hypothetical protein [Candidatus Woesearchaeota archaeon]
MIEAEATGRAAVTGNPGDVYLEDALVLAYSIKNKAIVKLDDSNKLIINSETNLDSTHKLIHQALKHFNIAAPLKIDYSSDIPFKCGLGGSAAILVSLIACLNKRFNLNLSLTDISKHALQIERELKINAGWQDRAVAVFGSSLIDCKNFTCQKLTSIPQGMYIVYYGKNNTSKDIHNNGKKKGSEEFISLMKKTREITLDAHAALQKMDWKRLGLLMNNNWEIRESTLGLTKEDKLVKDLILKNKGFANQTGSGGAAIVLDLENKLKPVFEENNIKIIQLILNGGLKIR